MAEALKNMYNEKFLLELGTKIKQSYSSFKKESFTKKVLLEPWEELTLKERMRKISTILGQFLPQSYEEALEVLYTIRNEKPDFQHVILADFVEVYGQAEENWESSITALEKFTKLSTSEFAVRPFIINNKERMMKQMKKWAYSNCEHVRRLASEGCRSRLPWGIALSEFKKDPNLVIETLEVLKNDDSKYVRKSVANNINDISKDNPEIVVQLAKRWMQGANADTIWIIRHGCRTLIKKANPEIMELFGYNVSSEEIHLSASLLTNRQELSIGEESELTYRVSFDGIEETRVRIEYTIDFVKANGSTSRKILFLSDRTVHGAVSLSGKKKHSWKDLSTRKHYSGMHKIVLLLNGREVSSTTVNLTENR